jgi:hypothetical protein
MTSISDPHPSHSSLSELDAARARLGLASDAPPQVVRAAFQRYALEHHPDRGGDPEAFRLGVDAYHLLGQAPPPAPNVVFFARRRRWRALLRRARSPFRPRR